MYNFRGSINVPDKLLLDRQLGTYIEHDNNINSMIFSVNNKKTLELSSINGIGISGDLGVTGNFDITGNGIIGGDLSVTGDALITGDLRVDGALITMNVDNVVIEDPLIKQAKNNTSDIIDIGHYGVYNDGTTRFTGLVRDASDGAFKFFTGITSEPTTTVDFTNPALSYANVQLNTLTGATGIFTNDFIVNTSDLFVDTTTRFVGIGATSLTSKLEVLADTINSDNETSFHGLRIKTGSTDQSLFMGYDGTDDIGYINCAKTGSVTNLGLQTRGGYVGIGITNPTNELEVIGTIGVSGNILPLLTNEFDLGSTSSRFNDLFLNGSSIFLADSQISADNTNDLQFKTGGSTKFQLSSTGEALLFATGVTEANSMMIFRKDVTTGVTDNRYINFEDGSTDILTAGTALGGIRVDTGGSLVIDTVSSIQLKENVRDNSDECYDLVKTLRGVKFDWKHGRAKDCNGFIAEEVKELYPTASGNINGINTVSMGSFIPILWSALRKSQEKIEEMDTKYNELAKKYGYITLDNTDNIDSSKYQSTSLEEQENAEKLLEENNNNDEFTLIMGGKLYKRIDGKYVLIG